ncbi:MAG: hypothetical protein NTW10_11325 [Bacteroidetes bacterium]|nr:hypothetical protein [Bacteroidota bacterium]
MIMRRLSFCLIFLILFSLSMQAQERLTLPVMEDSLSLIQRMIRKTVNDSARLSLNNLFRNTLKTAIGLPGSFSYPFDSLKKMAKLTSPDKRFRIYNWNIPRAEGSNSYFCLLQIQDRKSKNSFTLIEFLDRSDSISDPEHTVLGPGSWYGSLYYKIIPEGSDAGMIYTLLGWQGVSSVENHKLIEILTFDEKESPHLGKKIFYKFLNGQNVRVIFRYSPAASMVLRYEDQYVVKEKNQNSSGRPSDSNGKKSSMIIADRLETVHPPEGTSPILVAAGDVFDGFIFENGRWNFIEGVDARNR